jgi:K+ transporter
VSLDRPAVPLIQPQLILGTSTRRAPGAVVLLAADLLFFAANLTKLVYGAWLPLLIAIAVFTILATWQRGQEPVTVSTNATRARCGSSSTTCTP